MKKLLRLALLAFVVLPFFGPTARPEVHEFNNDPSIIRTLTIYYELVETSDYGGTQVLDYGWFDVSLYNGEAYDCDDEFGFNADDSMWSYIETVVGESDNPDPNYVEETWESYDDPWDWEYGEWSPDPSGTWEDQWCEQSRTNSRWHTTGEVSNLDHYRNEGSYTECETESQVVQGTRQLNWEPFDEIISGWYESAPWSPDPSDEWEDRDFVQNRVMTRDHRTGWSNDRGEEAGVSIEQEDEGEDRIVTGTRPLNWETFEEVTEEWHEISGWSPAPDTEWEDRSLTQTRTMEQTRRTGERNDRDGDYNVEEFTDTEDETRSVQGTRPLNWQGIDQIIQAWHAVGDWSPATSTQWEDLPLPQTRPKAQMHHAFERNDRGDERNAHDYTEDGTETRTVSGSRPLNWQIDNNHVYLGAFDAAGATWQGPDPTTKVTYSTVTQTLARVLRWEIWRINDRGNAALGDLVYLGLNNVPTTSLTRTLAGTRIPASVQIAGPGGTTLGVTMSGGGLSTGPIAIGGSTITLGTNSGTIVLSNGATISVSSSGGVAVTGVPGVPSGPLTGTVDLGGAGTLQIDSSGNASLTVGSGVPLLGGATINASLGGGGSIVFSNGSGITMSASGCLGLILPTGTDPAIVKAVDVLGAILQPDSGAVISVRSVLGAITPLPSSGILGDIDVGITAQGRFELGVKVDDTHTFWFDVSLTALPAPKFVPRPNMVQRGWDANLEATPWTSVATTSAAGVQNQVVRFNVADRSLSAVGFEVATAGRSNLANVDTSGRLLASPNGAVFALTGAYTDVPIYSALQTGDGPWAAEIVAKVKDANGNLGAEITRVKIRVLKQREFKIHLFKVIDSNSSATNFTQMPTMAQTLATLNSVYEQAAIRFVAGDAITLGSPELGFSYDSITALSTHGNGKLDGGDPTDSSTEWNQLKASLKTYVVNHYDDAAKRVDFFAFVFKESANPSGLVLSDGTTSYMQRGGNLLGPGPGLPGNQNRIYGPFLASVGFIDAEEIAAGIGHEIGVCCPNRLVIEHP